MSRELQIHWAGREKESLLKCVVYFDCLLSTYYNSLKKF